MARIGESGDLLKCSFCGKSQKQVKKLIAGPGVYICDECIDLCNEIIEEELQESSEVTFTELPKPREIYEFLDQYVIGQDIAKKALSVAVYNHYKRVQADVGERTREDSVELSKSNILLLGPTGSGKTLLAQTLARMLNVPFAIADATALTEAGYVGEDVENILLKLIQAADYDVKKAETGIIYIDEIDKIASAGEMAGRDVSGRGVQTALLKLMEETEVPLRSANDLQGQLQAAMEFQKRGKIQRESINTRHILFIVSGAFDKLTDRVARRLKSSSIGFGADPLAAVTEPSQLLRLAGTRDFVDCGIEPEFIGRLPVRVVCDPLSEQDLYDILKRSEGSLIRQYERAFRCYGIEAVFTDDALRLISGLAALESTGARGLLTVCERLLRDFKYEFPGAGVKNFEITPDVLNHPSEAIERLLQAGAAEALGARRLVIEQFAARFGDQHGLVFRFEDEAVSRLIEVAEEKIIPVRDLCESLFKDYQFGLGLIRRNSGRSEFLIPAGAVDAPDRVLSQWVVASYRDNP